MLCIQNNNTNPYFNLASEEYILRNFSENCFMLWQNKPSIIVGKHQNTLAEINYEYVKKHNIDVVRRLSGGGTVFHDLGNLNFTFVQNVQENENLVDFKKYTKPIIEVLHQLGVNAKFEGRNDIMIDGKKISGNAEHVYKKRVLHHGTLLFSSVISDLSKALKTNPLKYNDKGVKSVRSRVVNISEYLFDAMDVIEFKKKIQNYILESENSPTLYSFSEDDVHQINKLVDEKYSTWNWSFGYSPKYNFEKTINTAKEAIEIQMNIEKGIIKKLKIVSYPSIEKDFSDFENSFIGIKHEESAIRKTLQKISYQEFLTGISIDDFTLALF